MIIEKVKYSQDNNGNVWIGIEASPEPNESGDDVFLAVQKKVKEWHEKAHPGTIAPAGELPVINKAHERLELLIDNSVTLEELMGYRDAALSSNVKSIVDAYNLRANQLSTL